jgi:hypothetical protein
LRREEVTTYRQPEEDIVVYRVNGPLENARCMFLDYVRSMNELRERPSFCHTLTIRGCPIPRRFVALADRLEEYVIYLR